jgi:predicted RNase H-like HicB family nuclease
LIIRNVDYARGETAEIKLEILLAPESRRRNVGHVHDALESVQTQQDAPWRQSGRSGTCSTFSLTMREVSEIVFEITRDEDGGFSAKCLKESIFTQGDTWDELRDNIREAVDAFYFDSPKPESIRLALG